MGNCRRTDRAFEYRSKHDLQRDNPSVKDGLSPEKDRLWRRQYSYLIQQTGIRVKPHLPQWAIAVAMLLCHKFFSVKSMKRNDRWVIATACLFLASKVEENPRHLAAIIKEVDRVLDPTCRKADDPAYVERRKEEVLMAERALLYSMGFHFPVYHQPYQPLYNRMRELQTPDNDPALLERIMQHAFFIINDSLPTTLALQYPPDKIAFSALYWADQMSRVDGAHRGLVIPPDPHTQQPRNWWTFFQLHVHECADIIQQMADEYEHSKDARSRLLDTAAVLHRPGSPLQGSGPAAAATSALAHAQLQAPQALAYPVPRASPVTVPRADAPSPLALPSTPALF